MKNFVLTAITGIILATTATAEAPETSLRPQERPWIDVVDMHLVYPGEIPSCDSGVEAPICDLAHGAEAAEAEILDLTPLQHAIESVLHELLIEE